MMYRAGACPRRRTAVGCAVSPAQRAGTPLTSLVREGEFAALWAATGEISAQWDRSSAGDRHVAGAPRDDSIFWLCRDD